MQFNAVADLFLLSLFKLKKKPNQLCGGGTTNKRSVPLPSIALEFIYALQARFTTFIYRNVALALLELRQCT